MPISKEKIAYNKHQNGSKRRGIGFHFTFEEWVVWWERHLGPDWFVKRGRKTGQYVMARNGDLGEYEETNVDCLLAPDNTSQRKINGTSPRGTKHGQTQLTELIVKKIYLATGSSVTISKRFGVTNDIVKNIRSKRAWIHTTATLPSDHIRRYKPRSFPSYR
jgi:hypothetical protein